MRLLYRPKKITYVHVLIKAHFLEELTIQSTLPSPNSVNLLKENMHQGTFNSQGKTVSSDITLVSKKISYN